MGVDCKIYLPANMSIDNVSRVIGAYCGCPVTKFPLDDGEGSYSAHIGGVRILPTSFPQMAQIIVDYECIDGESKHFVFYHFEGYGNEGLRMLSPPSTAFWIAVGVRLVDFFGGWVDFNDCDDEESDYDQTMRSWRENSPQDGREWQDFQDRILAIKPITESQWRFWDEDAAYKIGK